MNNEYCTKLTAYREMVEDLGLQDTFATGRVEAQFECIKDWSNHGDLESKKKWFEEQKKHCQMSVETIPLKDCEGWSTSQDNGNITHKSGAFFKVEGLRISLSTEREVSTGWDQPILTQIGFDGGLLGILRKRVNGIPRYLLEAKAEPGNYGLVLLSPTLQATFSNLKRAHGGSKPRFADIFESPDPNTMEKLFSNWMSEDGGRLYNKRNYGMLIEVDEDFELEIPDTFNWFSLWQIKELLKEDAWVNPHIRGIIAHL